METDCTLIIIIAAHKWNEYIKCYIMAYVVYLILLGAFIIPL